LEDLDVWLLDVKLIDIDIVFENTGLHVAHVWLLILRRWNKVERVG
jgi:hypothetical protein